MNANEILTAAVATLDQRGKDYDQPGGERSMGRIVAAFNALTDHEMTEAEGWQRALHHAGNHPRRGAGIHPGHAGKP